MTNHVCATCRGPIQFSDSYVTEVVPPPFADARTDDALARWLRHHLDCWKPHEREVVAVHIVGRRAA